MPTDELLKSCSVPAQSVAMPPAPPLRILSSSLFAYAAFILSAAIISRYTATQIFLNEKGISFYSVLLTNKGILYYSVETVGWFLALFMGSFVAGYRAARRGWIAGLLVGVYFGLLIIAYGAHLSAGFGLYSLAPTASFMRRHPEFWPGVTLVILALPIASLGGWLGDHAYENSPGVEDPKRHTLFGVPWWHCAWLVLFLPALVVSDLLFSGYLFASGVFLAVLSAVHLRVFAMILAIATFAGFVAVWFGVVALWQGLSVHTKWTIARRIATTAVGLVLLFGVNFFWHIASSTVHAGIGSLSAGSDQRLVSEFLITPGESIGEIKLDMSMKSAVALLGRPQHTETGKDSSTGQGAIYSDWFGPSRPGANSAPTDTGIAVMATRAGRITRILVLGDDRYVTTLGIRVGADEAEVKTVMGQPEKEDATKYLRSLHYPGVTFAIGTGRSTGGYGAVYGISVTK
jgi:hypothetical protein